MKSIKIYGEPMWVYDRDSDMFVYGPCKKIDKQNVLIFREKACDPAEDGEVEILDNPYYSVVDFNAKYPMEDCVSENLTVLRESVQKLFDRNHAEAKAKIDEAANTAYNALALLNTLNCHYDAEDAIEKVLGSLSQYTIIDYLDKHCRRTISTDTNVIKYGKAIVMWKKGYIELPVRDEDDNAPCVNVPLGKIAYVEYYRKNKQSYISFKATDGTAYVYKECVDAKDKYESYLVLLSLGLVK